MEDAGDVIALLTVLTEVVVAPEQFLSVNGGDAVIGIAVLDQHQLGMGRN